MLTELLLPVLMIAIPVGVFGWFIASLTLFLRMPKEDTEKRENRKTLTIVSGIIAGVMLAAILALVILLSVALTHM